MSQTNDGPVQEERAGSRGQAAAAQAVPQETHARLEEAILVPVITGKQACLDALRDPLCSHCMALITCTATPFADAPACSLEGSNPPVCQQKRTSMSVGFKA